MSKVRVRFAPSPTGPLHIGGLRTALYNYLFAKKMGGTFILRIEDTDRSRYVEGAEKYILEALKWSGLELDESIEKEGDFGPYRQSDRKAMYEKYAEELVSNGHAYYAFDTPEELAKMREDLKTKEDPNPKYNYVTRGNMKNSLSLSEDELKAMIDNGTPYIIRLKVEPGEQIQFSDIVRGEVTFSSNELDDKVLMKTDKMPTYHMANIVDDHFMEISHVIRGEEWLPSTPTHVLLYRYLGWEDTMPQFCHLPLILKPDGKGKLSKRYGAKMGVPVFPLEWKDKEDLFIGFREGGFLPEAMINFLAFLGWNPGTEQEIFTPGDLIQAFELERINKSGARFDIEKARWFNQQYIMQTSDAELAKLVRPYVEAEGHQPTDDYLQKVCGLMKERFEVLTDFWENSRYFFEEVSSYDNEKIIRKRWKPENRKKMQDLKSTINRLSNFTGENIEAHVKKFIEEKELSFGEVLPFIRLAVSGTTKGASVFEMMSVLGEDEVAKRLARGFEDFDKIKENA